MPMPTATPLSGGNAVKKSKERISAQLKELWDYAGSVASAELGAEEPEFVNPSPEKVTQTVDKINRALEGKNRWIRR